MLRLLPCRPSRRTGGRGLKRKSPGAADLVGGSAASFCATRRAMIRPTRRTFLSAAASLLAAPAIIRASSLMPVKPWAAPALPDTWLPCDGRYLPRADYPELFAAIATAYGVGDGATTFALPDLRPSLDAPVVPYILVSGSDDRPPLFHGRSSRGLRLHDPHRRLLLPNDPQVAPQALFVRPSASVSVGLELATTSRLSASKKRPSCS